VEEEEGQAVGSAEVEESRGVLVAAIIDTRYVKQEVT
jgi:hypothetical protein